MYVQEQMFSVTVTVDGTPIQDSFDTFDGGDVKTDAKTYKPGGMADAEPLSGTPVTEDVSVGRGYKAERDAPLRKWLIGKLNTEISIGKQALGPDKVPVEGGLETFRGILTGVSTPKFNSEGDSVTMLVLTATIAGTPT
jgi:hypothetical protein